MLLAEELVSFIVFFLIPFSRYSFFFFFMNAGKERNAVLFFYSSFRRRGRDGRDFLVKIRSDLR